MRIRSFASVLVAGVLSCGGITGVDYQPYNCGGKTCAADEVCVTRGYMMIYILLPVYEKVTGCEKKTGLGANSQEPYWIKMPDGTLISRSAYIALPDSQKAKNADGTLRDPDKIWTQLTSK